VNPRLCQGQSGSSPDPSNDGEGVNYLRRLKGAAPETTPANVVMNRGDETPGSAKASSWKDQQLSSSKRVSSADSRAFTDEIEGFFQKNHTLSRDEFHKIAKRLGQH
jgi:hypothetical protein